MSADGARMAGALAHGKPGAGGEGSPLAGEGSRRPRNGGPLVLMRNYRPHPKILWPDGWNASRSSLLPATSFPIPELLNASVFAPTIVTCRCGSQRSTRRPAMAVCKPAAVSGCVQSAAQGGGASPWGNTAGNGPASRLWRRSASADPNCTPYPFRRPGRASGEARQGFEWLPG